MEGVGLTISNRITSLISSELFASGQCSSCNCKKVGPFHHNVSSFAVIPLDGRSMGFSMPGQ